MTGSTFRSHILPNILKNGYFPRLNYHYVSAGNRPLRRPPGRAARGQPVSLHLAGLVKSVVLKEKGGGAVRGHRGDVAGAAGLSVCGSLLPRITTRLSVRERVRLFDRYLLFGCSGRLPSSTPRAPPCVLSLQQCGKLPGNPLIDADGLLELPDADALGGLVSNVDTAGTHDQRRR
jgi:hypothetical protein